MALLRPTRDQLLRGGVTLAAVLVVAWMVRHVLYPLTWHPHGYGFWDWDQMESHRYLVVKTLKRFHQFPFWNPYACGGHPAWAGFESDTILVTPWLPAYLLASLPVAMRWEIGLQAVLSATGAWALATRFTRSPAARAFVAVVFAVNGRWTLQVTAGHTWFLVYAFTPWALFFFDRAIEAGRARPLREVVAAAGCLAMMVYAGGIYPLPQTVVVLALYAAVVAFSLRSVRPLVALAGTGVVSIGLAAPKLLPILDVMRRYPRSIDSTEMLTVQQFATLLTDKDQGFHSSHDGIAWHSWHEVGMYLGWVAVLVLIVGSVLGRGVRAKAARVVGVVLVAFSFGSFNEYAPWSLAHHLPILSSEHVPFRWLYPAVLLLACVTAAAVERGMMRTGRLRLGVEAAAVLLVAWIARDIATVARFPFEDHFDYDGPANQDSTGPFTTTEKLPKALDYPGNSWWAPTTLPAEIANMGTIECNTFHGLNNFSGLSDVVPGYEGRPTGLGAHGEGEPGYRGEVYLDGGPGTASFASWSPNAIDVHVEGANPGQAVVVNQNWDPGWSVDGMQAVDYLDTIAGRVTSPSQTLHFRYRAPLFWPGCALFLATVVGLLYAGTRRQLFARWLASVGESTADAGGAAGDGTDQRQAETSASTSEAPPTS
ncbi:MAG TPA: hypothetical protein VGG39_14310 [Polyangiaceae bacterium]|jgi:hypothetical protein